MAFVEPAAGMDAVVSVPTNFSTSKHPRSSPFAEAKDVSAAAAVDQSPFSIAEAQQGTLPIRTPSPVQQQPQQQQQGRPHKKVSFSKRLFSCACVQPSVSEDGFDADIHVSRSQSLVTTSSSSWGDMHRKKGQWDMSPRKSLMRQASAAYTDVDWFDARSEFSSALSGAASDQVAKLEELSIMVKELALAKAPWIPDPPLAFAQPGMTFIPVPAHTGFGFYWERVEERCTPFPTPIDTMTKASALAQRSHASIPGIWLQETDNSFSVTVKPRFMPPGLPRYTETYDKSNATEPSWNMRRDLRLGSTSGQIFMATDGTLILRARSRPMFGSVDFVMEEYMRLEEGGEIIVDRMCCLELKSGNRATQYVVGRRHEVPPKGHV